MSLIIILMVFSYLYTKYIARIPIGTLTCGLAGHSGTGATMQELLTLLLFAESRGRDAVGVYASKTNTVLKDIGSVRPFAMINAQRMREMTEESDMVILHTRAATMGGQIKANAHPYIFKPDTRKEGVEYQGTFVGAHNGWLFNSYLEDMAEEHGIDNPDVDSKLIFEILAANNMDFSSLTTVEGTMALSFEYNGVLHLYRRTSKPLFIGAKKSGIYYSSVEVALKAIGCDNVQEVAPNIMHRFKAGKMLPAIYVGDARYIKNLSCDPPMFKWREQVGAEMANKIPYTSLSTRRRAEANKNNPPTNNVANSPKRMGMGKFGPKRTSDGMLNIDIEDFIEGKLKGYRTVEVDRKLVDYKLWDAKAKESFIIITAVDNNTGELLKNQLLVSDQSSGVAMTNDDGIAIMHFGEFVGQARIYTGDPKLKKTAYSTLFNVKRGRVLEVTLRLPFLLSEKEAQEQGDGEGSESRISPQVRSRSEVRTDEAAESDLFERPGDEYPMDTRVRCGEEGSGSGLMCGQKRAVYELNLCDMFGVDPATPLHVLEELDKCNTELVEVQKGVATMKEKLDIGNDNTLAETAELSNTLVLLELEEMDLTGKMRNLMVTHDYYNL